LQPTLGGFLRLTSYGTTSSNIFAGKPTGVSQSANWSSYCSGFSSLGVSTGGLSAGTTMSITLALNPGTYLVALHNHALFGGTTSATFVQEVAYAWTVTGAAVFVNSPFGEPINASSRTKFSLSVPAGGSNITEFGGSAFVPPIGAFCLVKITGAGGSVVYTVANNSTAAAVALYTVPGEDSELTSIMLVPVSFGNPPTLKQQEDARFAQMEKRIAELSKRQELSTGDNFVVVRTSDSRKERDPDFAVVGAGGGVRLRDPSPGARRGVPVASPAPPGYVSISTQDGRDVRDGG